MSASTTTVPRRRRKSPESAVTSALVLSGTAFAKWAPERAVRVLEELRGLGWDVTEIPADHPDHPAKQRARDGQPDG